MVLVFAIAACLPRPWLWLAAVLVAGTAQDLRTDGDDNVVVDWAFFIFAATVGRIVHVRNARVETLSHRLQLADSERHIRPGRPSLENAPSSRGSCTTSSRTR